MRGTAPSRVDRLLLTPAHRPRHRDRNHSRAQRCQDSAAAIQGDAAQPRCEPDTAAIPSSP